MLKAETLWIDSCCCQWHKCFSVVSGVSCKPAQRCVQVHKHESERSRMFANSFMSTLSLPQTFANTHKQFKKAYKGLDEGLPTKRNNYTQWFRFSVQRRHVCHNHLPMLAEFKRTSIAQMTAAVPHCAKLPSMHRGRSHSCSGTVLH